MVSHHAGELFERLDSGAHDLAAPEVEELAGPGARVVRPEGVELFAEKHGPSGSQVGAQDVPELDVFLSRSVFGAAKDGPTAPFEELTSRFGAKLAGFGGANLVDGFTQMGHDVEAVEDMKSMGDLLTDGPQVGLPHVAADEAELGHALGPEPLEEGIDGVERAVLADPDQAADADVDLVDEGEVGLAEFPLYLVDSDGLDAGVVGMGSSPLDGSLDGPEDRLEAGAEDLRHFTPAQTARPRGQEPLEAARGLPFADRPGNRLHPYPAPPAVDPAHRVEKHHRNAPERNVLELSPGESVVSRAASRAARADRS